jgi:hypothetical protein
MRPNRRNGAVPKLQCRGHGSGPIDFSSTTAALFAATSGATTESEERVDQPHYLPHIISALQPTLSESSI